VRVYPPGVTPNPTPRQLQLRPHAHAHAEPDSDPTPMPRQPDPHANPTPRPAPWPSTSRQPPGQRGGLHDSLRGVNRSAPNTPASRASALRRTSDDASVPRRLLARGQSGAGAPEQDCWLGINGFPTGGSRGPVPGRHRRLRAEAPRPRSHAILELHWSAPGPFPANWQEGCRRRPLAHVLEPGRQRLQNDPATFRPVHEPVGVDYRAGGTAALRGGSTNGRGRGGRRHAAASSPPAATPVPSTSHARGLELANDMTGWLTTSPPSGGPARRQLPHLQLQHLPRKRPAGMPRWPGGRPGPAHHRRAWRHRGTATFINAYMAWAEPKGISYLAWTWDTWGAANGAC